MVYPYDEITQLSRRFVLSENQQQSLLEVLTIPDFQKLLQNSYINLNDLVFHPDKESSKSSILYIMPKRTAEAIKSNAVFLEKLPYFNKQINLRQTFYWINTPLSTFCYTLKFENGVNLSESFLPTFVSLEGYLKRQFSLNPEYFYIEEDLESLRGLKQTQPKRSAAMQMIEKYGIEKISDFFEKFVSGHPILILRKTALESSIQRYLKLSGQPLREKSKKFFSEVLLRDGKSVSSTNFYLKKNRRPIWCCIENRLPNSGR